MPVGSADAERVIASVKCADVITEIVIIARRVELSLVHNVAVVDAYGQAKQLKVISRIDAGRQCVTKDHKIVDEVIIRRGHDPIKKYILDSRTVFFIGLVAGFDEIAEVAAVA